MLEMFNSFSQDMFYSLSQLSSITIVAGIICIVGFLAYLCTRWTECLLVWTIAFGYAILPFLPHAA